MKTFILSSAFALLAVFLSAGTTAFAHGDEVELQTKTPEGFISEIRYSSEEPVAGESVRFDFFLFEDEEGREEISFTDLWVQIEAGEQTLLATGIPEAKFGATGLLYAFPKEGRYTLNIRYQRDGETLTEIASPFFIHSDDTAGDTTPEVLPWIYGGILGFLIGGASVPALLRRRLRKKNSA